MKPVILIYSSDMEFYSLLNHILDVGGFASKLADSAEEAFLAAARYRPFAVILDCQPSSPAAELCSKLKQDKTTVDIFVVALVGQDADAQYAELLKADVDESFVRPLTPARLLDALRSALTALPFETREGDQHRRLSFADIEMNLNTYRVYRAGKELHLCPIEFRILRHLLARPGQVFSRDELIRAVWPDNIFVDARTVDVHIGRLRRTLKAVAETDMIRTVRSAGYALAG
jgi:two-component system, OmpR family, phosphate regulon response regulator PhoB